MAKRWLKTTLIASVASVLALTAAGCGSSGTTDKGATGSTSGTTAPANNAKKEPVTLSIMYNWSSPNVDNGIYKDRIKKFMADNPDIKIEEESVPSEQYRTKLRTLAAGKKLPDMFILFPGVDMDPLVSGGVLMPIDDIMDTWKGMLPEDAIAGFKVNGKQYAIPTKQTFVDIVYYNKELLAKVGYTEFPKTYADLLELIKKLKAAGITPLALGNKDRWPLQSSWMSAIADRFTGSDFLYKVNKGEAKYTDPEFVKALGVIEEFAKLDAFNPDMNTMDVVQVQDYFMQGKAAIHITSSTIDAKFRHENPKGDNIGIALFPAVEGGKGDPKKSASAVQYGIGLNSQLEGAKKEAAQKFLKYFYSKELYQTLLSKGIVVPARVEMPADANKYLREMIELTNKGTSPVFDAVALIPVKDVIENGLQAITTKQKTAEQVAKEMQAAQEKAK
ncbi:extracellular solute-binding protein [Paenibacillus flagellatus]|uniref:extracellular solute-binding protein n=1 Tax=Paenibacillus flagellatus TaxID=2211139 RepID=UPI001FE9FA5C|nr:extracellular solute-binding protein [Paenibacillus flagellatus]